MSGMAGRIQRARRSTRGWLCAGVGGFAVAALGLLLMVFEPVDDRWGEPVAGSVIFGFFFGIFALARHVAARERGEALLGELVESIAERALGGVLRAFEERGRLGELELREMLLQGAGAEAGAQLELLAPDLQAVAKADAFRKLVALLRLDGGFEPDRWVDDELGIVTGWRRRRRIDQESPALDQPSREHVAGPGDPGGLEDDREGEWIAEAEAPPWRDGYPPPDDLRQEPADDRSAWHPEVPAEAQALARDYALLLAEELLAPLAELLEHVRHLGEQALAPELLETTGLAEPATLRGGLEAFEDLRSTLSEDGTIECRFFRGEDYVFALDEEFRFVIGRDAVRWRLRRFELGPGLTRELEQAAGRLRRAQNSAASMLLSVVGQALRWMSPRPRARTAPDPEIAGQIRQAGDLLLRLISLLRRFEETHGAFLETQGGPAAREQFDALATAIRPFWPAVEIGDPLAIDAGAEAARTQIQLTLRLPGLGLNRLEPTLHFEHARIDDDWKLTALQLQLLAGRRFDLLSA